MRPFFDSKDRADAFWREAKSWEGTPYFANACSRGHGVGCVNLINALFAGSGALAAPLELPAYQTDFAHHSTDTQLLRFLLEHPALRGRLLFVPLKGKRMVGDLYGVRSGRLDHHLAAYAGFGKIVQAVEDHGVIISPEDDTKFAARVLYVLRYMEPSK